MTDTQSVGLTNDQRELVLRGLRFVRSALSMELLEYSDAEAARRSRQIREVDSLVRQLGGKADRVAAGV